MYSFLSIMFDPLNHILDKIEKTILAKKNVAKKTHVHRATDIYLESILMSSNNNIYWVDTDSRVIGCNDQQAKIMNLSSRLDLIGKDPFDIGKMLGWDVAVAQKIRENDLKVMRTRKSVITEEIVTLHGEEHFYLACKAPMIDDLDEVIGVMGISTDITNQKRIEQKLEKANQAKTWFIANMSHDMRTPVAGMQGVAEMLTKKLPPQFQPEMNTLIKAGDELLALLNNILMLSKQELGEIQNTPPKTFDLYLLLNQLLELFIPFAKQKNLNLNLNYSDDIPRQFVSIPLLLQRIMLNLVSNALKFTETGGVTLNVSQENGVVLIEVADTGPGIPEEYWEKVFESFFRLKPSYQDQQEGSGLGLTIVRQFVEQLNGKIWVESEVGQGSRFFVRLPLLASKAVDVTDHAAETIRDSYTKTQLSALQADMPLEIEQSFAKTVQPFQVLLVEDNQLIQKTATYLLNQLNSHADIASTAEQAVELAQKNTYDLILMDIGLPEHDGFWAAQEIRRLKSYIHTPIIALTAHSDVEARDVFEQAGINEALLKPVNLEKMRNCFQRYGFKTIGG